jgi:hypothetical protein
MEEEYDAIVLGTGLKVWRLYKRDVENIVEQKNAKEYKTLKEVSLGMYPLGNALCFWQKGAPHRPQ